MNVVAHESFAGLEAALEERRRRVEAALPGVAPGGTSRVTEAALYSLLAPGKRLRPVLTLLVAEMMGIDPEPLLPAGCAVEMVHTASLILDDLPCMDNATTRRGRPVCHVVYGEATAVLAAFALQNRAFELLAEGWPGAPAEGHRLRLARELAGAIGLDGMIAGQAADLEMTDRPLNLGTLEFIHSRKTGALFIASAAFGAAGADEATRRAVLAYAKNLGLAFQIVDDLLDVEGDAGTLGKDAGQDVKKTTFVSFSGVEGARQLARELAATSERALSDFGPRARSLMELARYVVTRRR